LTVYLANSELDSNSTANGSELGIHSKDGFPKLKLWSVQSTTAVHLKALFQLEQICIFWSYTIYCSMIIHIN